MAAIGWHNKDRRRQRYVRRSVTSCLAIAFLVVAIAGPSACKRASHDQGVGGAKAPELGWVLDEHPTPGEVEIVLKAANNGDPEAALELSRYWLGREFDVGMMWLRRAASNGSVNAQASLGLMILGDPRLGSAEDGKDWLRKAAKAGDKWAAERLIDLNQPKKEEDPKSRRRREALAKWLPTNQPELDNSTRRKAALDAEQRRMLEELRGSGEVAMPGDAQVSTRPSGKP